MSTLRIHLLGSVRVTHEGLPIGISMGRAVKALLGYLTLFRHRFHAREVLAGLFWGDSSEKRARSCLSTTLWRLRKVLEPDRNTTGTYLVTTSMGEVGFNQESNHWLDIDVFEKKVKLFLTRPTESFKSEEANQLEKALNLHTGELMEGFYDDWALRERERLRTLYVNGQIHLLHHYSHHNAWEKGLACAQKILNLDPLREEIHREMMRLYFKNGERAQALRQYENCREILAAELGVAPMEETQILYKRILQKSGGKLTESNTQLDLAAANKLLQQLQQSIHDFEKSTDRLRRSAKALEGAINGRKSG